MRPKEYIEFSISKMCSEYIIKSWIGLVFFIGTLFYLLYVEEIEFGLVGIFLVAFLGIFCVLALRSLFVLYRIQRLLKRKAFPLLEAIYRKKLNAVVWIYQLDTTYTKKDYSSFNANTSTRRKKYLVVVLSDGKKIHIKARSEEHIAELTKFLSEVFPHAVIGFGPYQEADVEARIGKRIRNYFWFEF
jgi:hypothetical protein